MNDRLKIIIKREELYERVWQTPAKRLELSFLCFQMPAKRIRNNMLDNHIDSC